MTVYWVVWDAAANWIVDRLDAQGSLPSVRALRAAGCRAAARPPAPNCQTPPSLATLFTGTASGAHGVTGFTVPDAGTVAGHRSGFDPAFPGRPPIWRTLARRGMRSAFVHVPWVFDGDGRVGAGVDAAVEAYQQRIARHGVLPLVAGTTARWPVGELPDEIEVEATEDGGARLRAGGATHELSPRRGWTPVRLRAGVGFWVRHLGDALVRTGTWRARTGGSNAAAVRGMADAPVFAGEAVGRLYRGGLFGPRVTEGGDGSAERAYLSSVDCVVRSFDAATRAVLAHHDADLVVIYLPWTDDVGHEMAGWCDERSAAHRPDVADRVWEFLRYCYREADAVLGRVLARAGTDDTVLLGADHGIVGGTHVLHVNEVLIGAGLATRAADGGVDPRRSDVVYHPANSGLLRVNHAGRPGGVVPADRVGDAMRGAMTALLDQGPWVRGFVDALGRPVTPRDAGAIGDAYLVLADDYQPSAAADGGPVLRPMVKSGAHVVNTGDDRLHATFAARGPGIPAGIDLGVVDNTLGAHLALHQLGAGERPAALPGHDTVLGGPPR